MQKPRIVIVGGGASGTLLAWQLSRRGLAAQTLLIDPSAIPGRGLAYSTPCPQHLLNVRTSGMTALPDQPGHFLKWLRDCHEPGALRDGFATRASFGEYLHALFVRSGVTHLRAEATRYRQARFRPELALRDGTKVAAEMLVLATGNFAPAPLPGVKPAADRNGSYHRNAWSDGLFDRIAADQSVMLIGTGLTMVDVVLRLRANCHRGVIMAVSRSGLMPERHESYNPVRGEIISRDTPASAAAYLRAVRGPVRAGMPWRAVVDSLRPSENELWLALPDVERRRFRRHLQRRWDVVRHRMAPSVGDVIDRERASGGLVIYRGGVESVDAVGDKAEVAVRTAYGAEKFLPSHVINCTGPDMDYHRAGSALLRDLLSLGLAAPGFAGWGLRCDPSGALIGRNECISRTIFTLGPARLGSLFESIAIPEIGLQASDLAERLALETGG